MSFLTRIRGQFTRQALQQDHLNSEFEHYRSVINHYRVHNPLIGDLDFGGFVARNFAWKNEWTIVDASKFSNIQHAVDALRERGGFVMCPPQDYLIGAEPLIVDRDDIWIIGMGRGTRFLKTRIALPRSADKYDTAARGNPAVWFKKVSRCRLINVHVDMNDTQGKDLDPFPSAAIQANGCPEMVIQECKVSRYGDRTFQREPVGKKQAGFAAIDVRDSDGARVINNVIDGARSAAIFCGGTSVAFRGNTSDFFQGETRGRQVIYGNRMHNCDVGIQISPSANLSIVQNQLRDISGSGIVMIESFTSASSTRFGQNLQISDNQFSFIGMNVQEDLAAIWIDITGYQIENLRISGNQIEHVRGSTRFRGNGIYLQANQGGGGFGDVNASVTNTHVTNNQLIDVYDHGIYVVYQGIDENGPLRNFKLDSNQMHDFGLGPRLSRGISFILQANFGFSSNGIKSGQGISACNNTVISTGRAEYGILLANVKDSNPEAGDNIGDAIAAGGIIDGNIVNLAEVESVDIRLLGDLSTSVGYNVAERVILSNVVPDDLPDLEDL